MDAELLKLAINQGPAAVIALAIFLFWRKDVKNGITRWGEVVRRMEAREDAYTAAVKANTEASTRVADAIRLCPYNRENK